MFHIVFAVILLIFSIMSKFQDQQMQTYVASFIAFVMASGICSNIQESKIVFWVFFSLWNLRINCQQEVLVTVSLLDSSYTDLDHLNGNTDITGTCNIQYCEI